MELGLKRNEVRLTDYTPEWNAEFVRVKEEILTHTNMDETRIEHIGSTAIKGMRAKPIIDILLGVNDLTKVEESLITGLKQAGFLRLKVQREGEIVFAKFTDKTFEVKTHFIHMVEYQQEKWNNLIFFRDYLNTNEDARKTYLDIKEDYLQHKAEGITAYTEHKEQFVKRIFKIQKG